MDKSLHWKRVHHMDIRAVEMADRHYSRRSPGTPEFTATGQKIVLLHLLDDGTPAALWASHRCTPGKATRQDKLDVWDCSLFRVEHRTVLASELIREAVAITIGLWEPLPIDGFYTTINPKYVKPIKCRGRDTWGYCYIKAGWAVSPDRTRANNLVILALPLKQLQATLPLAVNYSIPPFGRIHRRIKWNKNISENQTTMEI